jgi:hypothetical protein
MFRVVARVEVEAGFWKQEAWEGEGAEVEAEAEAWVEA